MPKLAVNVLSALGLLALIAWLGGIALNKGFGLHVPFMAAWLLLVAVSFLVKNMAVNVATSWHTARIKADIELHTRALAAAGDLEGLVTSLAETAAEEDKSGAYL